MSNEPAPPPNSESTSTPETNDQPPNFFVKNWQFLAGFVGWYVVNGVIWFVVPIFADAVENLWAANMFFFFPLNLLALIILPLVKRTRKFGQGILAAVAINFILSILSGAFFNAVCFWPFYFR